MDEERNPPFFPLRTQTLSTCQAPALLPGLPAPPPRSRTIGQTDGRTDSAGPARPGAGTRAGRAGGALGVSAGCPLPAARPGGGCLGILFFFVSLPVRSLAAGVAPAGWTPMGVGEALTPPRLWQRRQPGSETPPSPGGCQLRSPASTHPPAGCAECSVLGGFSGPLRPPSGCSRQLPWVFVPPSTKLGTLWAPVSGGGWSVGCGVRDLTPGVPGLRGVGCPRALFGCQMGGAGPPGM